MNSLTLKHLRYFDALARYSHFGRAAAACYISQPALSVQIKELEALLGAPLVERTSRRVSLTTLGESVAERAQNVLRAVDDIADLVRTDRGQLSGPFRLGIIPTIAPYLLPQIISDLGGHFPALKIEPRESVTESLINKLLDAKLDAAILALPTSESDLTECPLFDERFVLVRSKDDEVAPVPTPHELQRMKLLLLEEGHCFRDQALSFCRVSGAAPRTLMEGSSLATLVQMVAAGIGVTLIPEMSVRQETRSVAVAISHFSEPAPTRTIGMVWRKTSPLADQMMQIGEHVREIGVQVRDGQHKVAG